MKLLSPFETTSSRIIRGKDGSASPAYVISNPAYALASIRYRYTPRAQYDYLGFRVCWGAQ